MRTLQVHFSSGRDVLGRYWGMLRGGGLRLDLPMLPVIPVRHGGLEDELVERLSTVTPLPTP